MNTPHRQQGLSSISWLVVILVAVFFGTCAVKLLPVYLQGWNINSTISKVVNSGDLNGKSPAAIRSKIGKLLDVNRIEGITAKDIKITREKGYTTIDATYEERMPLMYNIDVVIKFDNLVFEFANTGRD
jgi:hypothetical protein